MISYAHESGRGHKIDGEQVNAPNYSISVSINKPKPGIRTSEKKRTEKTSSQRRTLSPGKGAMEDTNKYKQ